MILCDREIKAALQHGQIEIDPLPPPEAYDSTTVDLTLSHIYEVWQSPKPGRTEIIEPGLPGWKFAHLADLHPPLDMKDGYVLEPRSFILCRTREKIALPHTSRIAARVEGKSSLARLGLGVHMTAPTIQAGFRSHLQLEISNVGSLKIKLVPGMRICQLIFEMVFGTPEQGYKGEFLDQFLTK